MKLLNYEAVVHLVEKTKGFCLEQVGNHDHSASDIASGTLGILYGGTGAASAKEARASLSIYSIAEVDAKLGDISTVLESLTGVSA